MTDKYNNVDVGVREPVRILEEELGYKAVASSEGKMVIGGSNSYITIEYCGSVKKLLDHLSRNHFIMTSKREIKNDKGQVVGRMASFGKRPLLAQLILSNGDTTKFRMEVFKVDMPEGNYNPFFGEDRRSWEELRKIGWVEWIDILRVLDAVR